MDPLTEKRKEKILKVRLKYAEIVKDLECPFVWHFYKLFDAIEFSRFFQNTASIADLSLNTDETQALADYSDQTVKIYCHFIMNGAQFALNELSLFMRKLSECGSDGSKNSLTFVAKSCEIFLHLLSGNKDQAVRLKQSLQFVASRNDKGHLEGIHGLIAVQFNENLYAQPFLRRALSATSYYEYAFDLAKTIARLRRVRSSLNVTEEEISLFEQVAKEHSFAIPMLLDSLGAKIRFLKQSRSFDEMNRVQRKQEILLKDAWTKRETFGAKGLTRLADTFSIKRDSAKAGELYAMAYTLLPNCPYNLHKYGVFLTKHKPGKTIEDVSKGLDFYARAKHLPAFASLIEVYYGRTAVNTTSLKPFESYLESFAFNAQSKPEKLLFAYVAYKYYLELLPEQADSLTTKYSLIRKALDYLKLAIEVDADELTFTPELKSWHKSLISSIKIKSKSIFIPAEIDLSYEAGYINDGYYIAMFGEKNVNSFNAWWLQHPTLKPMDQYPGYKAYFRKNSEKFEKQQRYSRKSDGFSGGFNTNRGAGSSRSGQRRSAPSGGRREESYRPSGAAYREDNSRPDKPADQGTSASGAKSSSKIATNETITDARTAALQPMKKELALLEKNKTSSSPNFLTFIYKNFFPKHKPDADAVRLAMSVENIQEASRSGKMKKMLLKALVHYHPDTIDGEAHGLAWKYFCEEISKVLTSKRSENKQ